MLKYEKYGVMILKHAQLEHWEELATSALHFGQHLDGQSWTDRQRDIKIYKYKKGELQQKLLY